MNTMSVSPNPKLAWLAKVPYSPIFKGENHIKFATENGMLNYYVSTGTFLYDGGCKLGAGVPALFSMLGIVNDTPDNGNFDMAEPKSHKVSKPVIEAPIDMPKAFTVPQQNMPKAFTIPQQNMYKGHQVYRLKYKKLEENAFPPKKTRLSDAGIDLFANAECEWTRHGKQWYTIVKTGIALEIPLGYYLATAPRSSVLFEHKISTYHSVLDTGYLGEVTFLCHSFSESKPQFIDIGERIAQVVLVPIPLIDTEFEEVTELPIHSDRGNKGFGSSGEIHKAYEESELPFDMN